jgi:hypothetical protein
VLLEGLRAGGLVDRQGSEPVQIWVRRKDNQMLAVFPEKFAEKKFFIALTVASGERYAGLQAGDMYVYWRGTTSGWSWSRRSWTSARPARPNPRPASSGCSPTA